MDAEKPAWTVNFTIFLRRKRSQKISFHNWQNMNIEASMHWDIIKMRRYVSTVQNYFKQKGFLKSGCIIY